MSPELIILFMFGSMLVLLASGQRVFAMIGAVGAASALMLWGDGGSQMAFNASIKLLNWYPLLTLPMFIFMGYMLSESGIANDLYDMIHEWTGWIPGGLAIGTILLMVLISAINGLSVAGMAIGCSVALPEMLKRRYDKRMISGVIQAGSSLGILVPPSIVLVLYGMIARQPVGQLWLAGIIPGLLMATMFILYVAIRCRIQPDLGPPLADEERSGYTAVQRLKLLANGLVPVVLMVAVIGLFLGGVTSLVESSAIGASASILIALFKRRLTFKVLHATARQTLNISAMFMWIILAALSFGAVFDGLGAVKAIEGLFINDWGLSPWQILILMQLSFVIMGMFLDDTAMLVIVAPLYVPLVAALGFSPIWFGILYTITCQVAYVTPPFGYNLFLMRAMAPREIGLKDIYASIVPFVIIMVITLLLIMIFPQLSLWLPEKFMVK
jgi:tripartite ATP-independent transporter DctM subunit